MNDVYMYGYDEEGDFYGDFTSREDAVVAGFENFPDAVEIYVGRRVVSTAHRFVDGESILEIIDDRAWHYSGEGAVDWLHGSITRPEKIAELEQLVGDWLQANAPPQFYNIEDVELVVRQTGGAK